MVLDVSPLTQSHVELYGSWKYKATVGQGEPVAHPQQLFVRSSIHRLCSESTSQRVHLLKDDGKCRPTCYPQGAPRPPTHASLAYTTATHISSPGSLSEIGKESTPTTSGVETLAAGSDTTQAVFSFTKMSQLVEHDFSQTSNNPSAYETAAKRARPKADVDGPNTYLLSSKKRRLRLHLITSRLSQPFSQPATHILNREGLMAGDRRFVKLAAQADSPRRFFSPCTNSLYRYAIINRLKLRYRANPPIQPIATPPANTLFNPLHISTRGRFFSQSSPLTPLSADQVEVEHATLIAEIQADSVGCISTPCMGDTADAASNEDDFGASFSGMAAPSPEYLPGSPDDDCTAFPTAEHESRYESSDEPEHVYSDFGAIFGGGSAADEDEDDHSYEEYLDELDGISWVSR
jgi:hypothetical protein